MTQPVVVGLDNGGTTNNATVLTLDGRFLVDGMAESPSRVQEGTDVAVASLVDAFEAILERTSISHCDVRAVGLDTPGPAGPDGVICSTGSTNFSHPSWRGFDVRAALEDRLAIPVVYNNDANAAALYAHQMFFGVRAAEVDSISVIVGTGLGGGIIHRGQVVKGASGMAAEVGHVPVGLEGILEVGQPIPSCNCGQTADVESVASLTAISKNLLPYWLSRFPGHPLGQLDLAAGARGLRSYGEAGDALARAVFEQQAKALGLLFTIAANFTDPHAYFVGGGVVQAGVEFRNWFLDTILDHMRLRPEQREVATVELVPDLDMAGARGSALAAWQAL